MRALVLAVAVVAATQNSPIFRFEADNMWLNLHHYLFVLGRFEAKMSDVTRRAQAGAPADEAAGLAGLSDAERATWREAVSAYARGLSKKDAVFDAEMFNATGALAALGSRTGLDRASALDPAVRAILEKAAPVYRKAWWPRHLKSNNDYVRSEARLVEQYGDKVRSYATRAYQETWSKDGYPVNITAFTNWAGAYSTHGVLVVSSQDPGNKDLLGLEIIFHESMHQWDDAMFEKLRSAAKAAGVARIPGGLTHAMIFFTAGQAVKSVAPSHVPYAEANDLWSGAPFSTFKPALEASWKPYLDGKTTLNEALTGLLK